MKYTGQVVRPLFTEIVKTAALAVFVAAYFLMHILLPYFGFQCGTLMLDLLLPLVLPDDAFTSGSVAWSEN